MLWNKLSTSSSLKFISKNRVVDSKYLSSRRKYVVVIMFATAAILTPPDPITQIGLALPLLLLYEISIFTVKLIEKKIMHNLKEIRKRCKFFKKIQEEMQQLIFENLLNLDKENREIIQKKEKFEQEKNIYLNIESKNFSKSKKLTQEIEKLEILQKSLKIKIDKIISSIPNIALDDVPIGVDEKSNKIVKKSKSKRNLILKLNLILN